MSRATTCIFFALFLFDARKDSENLTFILKQSLILLNVCVIIGTRPIGDSTTPRLDRVQ